MELKERNIKSYTEWNEWDSFDDDYKWCMRYLIERWIEWEERDHTQESTRTWLFE